MRCGNSSEGTAGNVDAIGEWSELKLEILEKYAGAYTRIIKAQRLRPI